MNENQERPMMRLPALAMLLLAMVAWLWLPSGAQAAKAVAKPTVVYHIDDSKRAVGMLRNIANHRRANAGIRIVVVALAGGVDFLVEGAMDDRGNSYDALVEPLMAEGVEFRVCNNTLSGRGIAASKLLPGSKVVPSGVAEVARLQLEEGAAYIKP